jgi:predicted small lipoprotein YifL
MRSCAAFAAILTLAIGLAACGKYGPPVRSVPQQPPSPAEATESEPVEEEVLEPADFDDAEADEENGQ